MSDKRRVEKEESEKRNEVSTELESSKPRRKNPKRKTTINQAYTYQIISKASSLLSRPPPSHFPPFAFPPVFFFSFSLALCFAFLAFFLSCSAAIFNSSAPPTRKEVVGEEEAVPMVSERLPASLVPLVSLKPLLLVIEIRGRFSWSMEDSQSAEDFWWCCCWWWWWCSWWS